jgi:type IV secretory pathway VirJ component
MIRSLVAFALLAMTAPAIAQTAPPADAIDAGIFGAARLFQPSIPLRGVTVLFSAASGWGNREAQAAERLRTAGAVVIGVDLPSYIAKLNGDDGSCLYPVAHIEAVSRQAQRAANVETYIAPTIAGFGAGGGLVLAIAQQTPAVTIDAALAVDAEAAPKLVKPLCNLDRTPPVSGIGTILATATPGAPAASAVLATQLAATGLDVRQTHAADDTAAFAPLVGTLETPQPTDPLAAIPLVELPVATPSDTLAIVYSGDGGWRDLDKTIAEYLQKQGMPVIGIDSLRYFWSEKLPPRIASDLDLMIATYGKRWKTTHVLLIGYSFGADILPETFNVLRPDRQKQVRQISLLGFAADGTFEISVAGWLGAGTADSRPVLPQLARIDPKLIQCFYGRDETDSACPQLDASKYELIGTDGGHHFDGNYDALGQRILDGLKGR